MLVETTGGDGKDYISSCYRKWFSTRYTGL